MNIQRTHTGKHQFKQGKHNDQQKQNCRNLEQPLNLYWQRAVPGGYLSVGWLASRRGGCLSVEISCKSQGSRLAMECRFVVDFCSDSFICSSGWLSIHRGIVRFKQKGGYLSVE